MELVVMRDLKSLAVTACRFESCLGHGISPKQLLISSMNKETQPANKKDLKRSLNSTFILLGAMLAASARDEGEIAIQPIAESIFGLNHPDVNHNIEELTRQGYLRIDDEGNLRMTAFGEKMALQSTQNTPNFARLAATNANTAFAMMFAAYIALRDTHLVNQPRIVTGDGGSNMVENLKQMVNYFQQKIG